MWATNMLWLTGLFWRWLRLVLLLSIIIVAGDESVNIVVVIVVLGAVVVSFNLLIAK